MIYIWFKNQNPSKLPFPFFPSQLLVHDCILVSRNLCWETNGERIGLMLAEFEQFKEHSAPLCYKTVEAEAGVHFSRDTECPLENFHFLLKWLNCRELATCLWAICLESVTDLACELLEQFFSPLLPFWFRKFWITFKEFLLECRVMATLKMSMNLYLCRSY